MKVWYSYKKSKPIFYLIIVFMITLNLYSCGPSATEQINAANIKIIDDMATQDSLFKLLADLSHIPDVRPKSDSIAFLILPIDAACPACRNKTIDSIIANKDKLKNNHYIIISGAGIRKIESYFLERNHDLPLSYDRILIDSLNRTFRDDLVLTKPTIYYSINQKVVKRITCVPRNIKKELAYYFSSNYH